VPRLSSDLLDASGPVEEVARQIGDLIEDWDNPAVEREIFGTADPTQIAPQVDAFCREHFGHHIRRPLFYRSSVGAVFGLELAGGQRVVIKVHQPDYPVTYLAAVQRVTRHLAEHGFPCPTPLLEPTPLGRGTATAEAYMAEGDYRDAHDPVVRRALARALARQIELTRTFVNTEGMRDRQAGEAKPSDRLWGKPHSALFDFDATAAGAEWIDEIGWRAKRLLARPAGREVVGHCDWSTKHFRFVGDEIRVVYDWDSLRVNAEPVIAGRAAHAFCAAYDTPFDGKVHHAPSHAEVLGFLADYEQARGAPFSSDERRTFGAACAYSLAYSSRCSHALDPRPGKVGDFPPGNWRASLADFGERLLEL
jgi:hypothetical protein